MRVVDRIRGRSWWIFVEDSRIQTRVYEYFNSPWNSVNLETVYNVPQTKRRLIDKKKTERREGMKSDESRKRFVWRGVKSISGRLWKFSSLSIFSCLQHSMKSNDRFCRSPDHWLTSEYCVYEWTMWGISPRDGVRFDLGSSGFLRFVETRWISSDE